MKKSLPDGYQSRPATMDDLNAAVDMFNIDSRRLLGVDKFILQETANEWQAPGFNQATDSLVVTSPDGTLAGYYQVWDLKPHVTIRCWGRVHPDHTDLGIGSYLLEWAHERACQGISQAPPEAREGAEMLQVRHALRMVVDLDSPPPAPKWPPGIIVRNLRVDQDEWDLTNAMVEAFRDHWGFVEMPIEEEHELWTHFFKNNDDFDLSLCFLAWDGDQIAGASLCWPYSHDDPYMGWVDELAVRKPWRRQGLGLALLHHSFGEFHARKVQRVGLGVDAQNLTGALRLYERAGMHSDPNRQYVVYERELRPGMEIRTQ
jgi:GNAT superfamily N-acetyltransferase